MKVVIVSRTALVVILDKDVVWTWLWGAGEGPVCCVLVFQRCQLGDGDISLLSLRNGMKAAAATLMSILEHAIGLERAFTASCRRCVWWLGFDMYGLGGDDTSGSTHSNAVKVSRTMFSAISIMPVD